MACFHPRPAARFKVDGVEVVTMISETEAMFRDDAFPVPCGKCIGCRLDQARERAIRCTLEASCWPENYFITLTYDDDHLPWDVSDETGEVAPTLRRRDVVLFRKQLDEELRKRGHVGVRQMTAGEYGSQTQRPHAHLLLFNLPLSDLRPWSRSSLGDLYYRSDLVEKCWPHGQVIIGEVTPQSSSYVARYCQKKAGGEPLPPPRAPEYLTSSNKPGIGAPWLEKNQIVDDLIYLPDGQIARPPRYFDRLREARGEDLSAVKAERRRVSDLLTSQHVAMTTRDYFQELEDLEAELTSRSRLLTRPLC